MRTLFTILFLSLLAPLATNAAEINIALDVYNKLSVTVSGRVYLPSTYDDKVGTVTSEDSTEVLNGTAGENATITVAGPPDKQYSLVFDETTKIVNQENSAYSLTVNLSMGTNGGNKTGRTLNSSGTDVTTIKGSSIFSGQLHPGTYSNEGSPTIVTAVYDAM